MHNSGMNSINNTWYANNKQFSTAIDVEDNVIREYQNIPETGLKIMIV